jgi:intergrase/recombinase
MADIEFTPEQQAKVDEIVKARISREKERWEKDSGVDDLRAQLEAKDEEIAQIQREHFRADARRAVVDELADRGVTEKGRVERVLRYVDLDEVEPDQDGTPHFGSVRQQLASISKDMPELLDFKLGAGSGGSKKPVLTQEKPLTREEVEKMSEEEVNSNWRRVQRFLQGERS